jgi:hypothetical protein
MSTASDTVELFRQTRYEALLAEKNANYPEALRLWLVLEGYIASTPDQERDGDSMTWRADVATHVARLQKIVAASRGIQQQKIVYCNPRGANCACDE